MEGRLGFVTHYLIPALSTASIELLGKGWEQRFWFSLLCLPCALFSALKAYKSNQVFCICYITAYYSENIISVDASQWKVSSKIPNTETASPWPLTENWKGTHGCLKPPHKRVSSSCFWLYLYPAQLRIWRHPCKVGSKVHLRQCPVPDSGQQRMRRRKEHKEQATDWVIPSLVHAPSFQQLAI